MSRSQKPSETVAQKRQTKAKCRPNRTLSDGEHMREYLTRERCHEVADDLIGDCAYARDPRDLYDTCLEPGRWRELDRNWHAATEAS